MENVLFGLQRCTQPLYLDEIIIIALMFEMHVTRLEKMLRKLRTVQLRLKPSKCALLQKEVKYLGHIASGQGVATDPAKIEALDDWP